MPPLIRDRFIAFVYSYVLAHDRRVIVFCDSRNQVAQCARSLSLLLPSGSVDSVACDAVLTSFPSPTKQCFALAESLRGGVGFHHAGLHQKQRLIVEDLFRENKVRVLFSTPTLAAGVDLPADTVIVRSAFRFDGLLSVQKSNAELLQLSGRAGRSTSSQEGHFLLYGDGLGKYASKSVLKHSLQVECVDSQLCGVRSFVPFVLSLIDGGFSCTVDSLVVFFERTFPSRFKGRSAIVKSVNGSLDLLIGDGLVEKRNDVFVSTSFGHVVNASMVHPSVVVTILKSLVGDDNDISLLVAMYNTHAFEPFAFIDRSHEDSCIRFYEDHKELFLKHVRLSSVQDVIRLVQVVRSIQALLFWIEEHGEDELYEQFYLSPGKFKTELRSIERVLDAVVGASYALKYDVSLRKRIRSLMVRLAHGVKSDVVPLLSCKEVDAKIARKLVGAGVLSLEDVEFAQESYLANYIGSDSAKRLKAALGHVDKLVVTDEAVGSKV